jgi:two-component system, response regulator RegA
MTQACALRTSFTTFDIFVCLMTALFSNAAIRDQNKGEQIVSNSEELGSVLIVDGEDAFNASLGRSLRQMGFSVYLSGDYRSAMIIAEKERPVLIATELRVGTEWAFDMRDEIKRCSPESHMAIETAFPSVATAVRSVRSGFDSYVSKPVEPRVLLELTGVVAMKETPHRPEVYAWPSLDRTIWEYINQVFVNAGSMSEAARRLRLDRRSLRRMLAKYPPHQ